MSEPFLSEIRIFSFGFAPRHWALCNGQVMPIAQNQALFSLLDKIYGGDGITTFALPNLQGRVPVHTGSFALGQAGGETAHALTLQEMPVHTHELQASAAPADKNTPFNMTLLGVTTPNNLYGPFNSPMALGPASVTNVGGSQAHPNTMPSLVLSFCIALQGIFPTPN